jgi:F-type H+-transporting ATPase subunit b
MMSTPRSWKSLALACALSGAAAYVTLVHGDGHARAKDLDEEVEAAEGHHGQLTLKEIFTGEERWQFWGSVVNFGLLVYVIIRMGKKPVRSFLSARRDGIARGISEAAEVKRAAEEAFNTYSERMKSLDTELAKLRKDVSEAAERDRARIVAEANDSVARLKAETEALVQRQTEQLEAQIRHEVVTAATEAAEKAVRELSTPDDQKRVADVFMRELGKLAKTAEEKRA